MSVHTPGQQPPLAFYEETGVAHAEADRLARMAMYADFVSLNALSQVAYEPHIVIVDVGAGDSTSLGQKLVDQNPTVVYRPLDMREEAVRAHKEFGFAAEQGYATKLPFPDSSVDAFHARFSMAWLDKQSRAKALDEMLRAGTDKANLAIIDYDWGTTEGPEPYQQLAKRLTQIVGAQGFDPYYGAKAAQELSDNLTERGYTAEHVLIEEQRIHLREKLSDALLTIQMTAQPVIDKLSQYGLNDDAFEVTALLDAVKTYANQHPDEEVIFPDIVSVTANLEGEELHRGLLMRVAAIRSAGAEALSQHALVAIGPGQLESFHLPGSMVEEARKLHANAYRNHNYVTDDGIKDGMLIEEIDPQHLVDASTYIGTLDVANGEERLEACIRLIGTVDKDLRSLPTIQKVVEALGEESDILKELPFMQSGKNVAEASALGKSAECIDKLVTSKILLAALTEAIEQNVDYLVMNIVKGTARLLTTAYGTKAFMRIDGDAAIVRLAGEGLRSEGVELVPFYVNTATFIDDVLEHFDINPESDFVKSNRLLFDLTKSHINANNSNAA